MLTTAHHGLAPPTTCYGATLGVLGTLSSAGSGMRQRHLVAGVVGGGGAGGVHGLLRNTFTTVTQLV